MAKKFFNDKPFYKKLGRLALPISFQFLMLALVAAADALMLGSVEQNSMSAVSIATQIQFVQNMMLCAIVSVTAILGAQYWGKKDSKAMDDIFCITVRLSFIISFLFFAGCVFVPDKLMIVFTDEKVLIDIGTKYLKIAGWSYLLTGFSQSYIAMMKVSDHASASAKISAVTVLLNIGLNAILIYGLFGFKALGAEGAAIATLVSRIAELILCLFVSLRKGYISLSVRGLFKRNRLLSEDFLKCLAPTFGSFILWSLGFTSYTAFMGHMGVDAAAANSVAAVVRDLICCLCEGLAGGGGIMVGNELGAGDLEKGKLYGDRITVLAFICGLISSAIMFIVTPLLMSFVDLTGDARKYLLQMMIIMSIYIIGRAVNTIVINGIFYAGGDAKFDFRTLVICMWCFAVPLAALGTFVFKWPVWVVYACTCLDEVGKIPWVMAHYRKYKWLKNLTRENM